MPRKAPEPILLGAQKYPALPYSITIGQVTDNKVRPNTRQANRCVPRTWFDAVVVRLREIAVRFGVAQESGDKKKLLHLQIFAVIRAPDDPRGVKAIAKDMRETLGCVTDDGSKVSLGFHCGPAATELSSFPIPAPLPVYWPTRRGTRPVAN
jgi:hypothetical protein